MEGTKTKHFLAKICGQQQAVSRPQARVLSYACISLRASAKKQKPDEWPVNAAHILSDSEFMVFWGIRGDGQPCGCSGRKFGERPPRPQ